MRSAHASLPSGAIHPAVWRATELAGQHHATRSTGHPVLDAALPGAGWPLGSLTELMPAREGIGELRLLAPALASVPRQRPIVLLQPPHPPNSLACESDYPAQWLWITPQRSQDAPWAAEQILKNNTCGALLYWQKDMPAQSVRRLHLAAQSSDMLFFLFRPDHAVGHASPAPLRLRLRAARTGLDVDIIKRRGPALHAPLLISLPLPAPHVVTHAPLDRPAPAPATAGSPAALLRA